MDEPGSAHTLYFLILYDPQQLGLGCQAQLSYFIEQENALNYASSKKPAFPCRLAPVKAPLS